MYSFKDADPAGGLRNAALPRIAPGDRCLPGEELSEELLVLFAAGKIKTASQQQSLVHGSLEPVVTLLHVSVLVGTCSLTLASGEPVVLEQGLVALREFLGMQGVVHCRRQPVCLVGMRRAT